MVIAEVMVLLLQPFGMPIGDVIEMLLWHALRVRGIKEYYVQTVEERELLRLQYLEVNHHGS